TPRGAFFHLAAEPPRPHPLRVAPGLAGADVELPVVPRTADDLAAPDVVVLARFVRQHEPGQMALAQAAAAVRASVAEREELAAQIEHHDETAIGGHEF